MRLLIDGYNVMHAGGLMGRVFKHDAFRKARARFLNDLADALGLLDAHQTTVVFDARTPPAELPARSLHKGITVIYAVGDENADARIELLIAGHTAPKGLKVVSSDRRVRQAATRRKAASVTADAFWVELDTLRERRKARPEVARPPAPRAPAGGAAEAAFWAEEFRDLDDLPETRAALGDGSPLLTDDDIARIELEVEREPG